MLKALDPLALHVIEKLLSRRTRDAALSFGESLDGTRDVLLVAARELSDLLAIVPTAAALRKRYRMARIHVLATPACAEVLAGRPEIFEVVEWSAANTPLLSRETLENVRQLRDRQFDLAIAVDDGSARRERVLAALSGARLRLGMHPEGSDPTLNLVVAMAASEGYRPVQSLEFLSFLGIPREQLTPCWHIPEADRRYAERLIELRRRGRSGWLLGVDPGRGRSGVRPHAAKLAWLVDKVAASRGAVPIVLTDDPEMDCVAEFKSHLKTPALEVPCRGLRDVLSLLGTTGLFLGGNTSLFHFAVALGVPSVGLFGQDDAERWVPRDRLSCHVERLSPGQRLKETEFLETVDRVRDTGFLAVPSGVGAPESDDFAEEDDPEEAPATEPARDAAVRRR